jgi:hypothetical protein
MTVPPLFGWEGLLVLLLLVVVVAVAFFVITAAGPATSERQDWQRFLDGRSRGPGTDLDDPTGEPAEGAESAGRRPPA